MNQKAKVLIRTFCAGFAWSNFLQSSKYGAVLWIYAEFGLENRDKLMKEQGPGRTFGPVERRAHTGAGLLA